MAALELKKKIRQGEALPRISAFSEIHYGKPGIDFFKNQWSLYFQAGISVDFTLFQWSKKKRDITIISNQLKKLANQKAEWIKRGKTSLAQLYETLATLSRKLELINQLADITHRDIQLKEKLLQEQQLSNLDYLAALTGNQKNLFQANDIIAQKELIKVYINKAIGISAEVQ
jgi:outer membrane protein TolC